MPLVRIDLQSGKSVAYRTTIGDVIYDAMLAVLNVPKDDRFQIIAEHPAQNLIVDPTFLGISRTEECVVIQVTLNDGRSVEQKRTFYKAIADGLQMQQARPTLKTIRGRSRIRPEERRQSRSF
jgi:4-oxalocrotonate tautomerase